MSDPFGPGGPAGGDEDRWAKWERWRQGDLQLPDPDLVLGEQGLGAPGEPARVPWRAREALWLFLAHILVTAVFAWPIALALEDTDAIMVAVILTQQAVLLTMTLGWARLRHKVGARALGLRAFTAGNVTLGVGIGLAGILGSIVIGGLLAFLIEQTTGEPAPQPDQLPLEHDPGRALLVLIGLSVVLLAPIAEETFFRGFLFGGLRRWARAWPTVLISSVVFALVHVQPIVLLPIFVLGVILGWVVERRRSVVPAIVAHLVFNLFGFIMLVIFGFGGSG